MAITIPSTAVDGLTRLPDRSPSFRSPTPTAELAAGFESAPASKIALGRRQLSVPPGAGRVDDRRRTSTWRSRSPRRSGSLSRHRLPLPRRSRPSRGSGAATGEPADLTVAPTTRALEGRPENCCSVKVGQLDRALAGKEAGCRRCPRGRDPGRVADRGPRRARPGQTSANWTGPTSTIVRTPRCCQPADRPGYPSIGCQPCTSKVARETLRRRWHGGRLSAVCTGPER